MKSSCICLTECVHTWRNDCQWCENYNIGFTSPIQPWSQRLRSNKLIICFVSCSANSPLIFDRGCSYLAQLLLMVCRLQGMLQITAMTLNQRSRLNYSKSIYNYTACNVYIFRRCFRFRTLGVYGLQLTKNVLDCCYDLAEKVQCQKGRTMR